MHTKVGDPGAVVVPLKMGEHGRLALVATKDTDGGSDIYAAVDIQDVEVNHLHRPAVEFGIGGKRYIGIPVKNSKQAGGVLHVIEDALKREIDVMVAIDYLAQKIRELS
jgi:hypothetical protein